MTADDVVLICIVAHYFEIATMQILPGAAARDYIMGQIATIERSRLKALDIETVGA